MNFVNTSLQLIHQAIIPEGIKASANGDDNYQAIWARDSVIAGLAGYLYNDEKILDALLCSINTLASHQAPNGLIPSNVSFDNDDQAHVSYGSLAGRVDATLWWLIGVGILGIKNKSAVLFLETQVSKALFLTDCWEHNNKQLIYTPLGGNWADEYIVEGHTLYDNALRYWAYSICANVFFNKDWEAKSRYIEASIFSNFSFGYPETNYTIHPKAFNNGSEKVLPYMPMSFNAAGYNTSWDMAGNAIALLIGLNKDHQNIQQYITSLTQELGHAHIPVFYPIIQPQDKNWDRLTENYNFSFKNKPHHFHNGGCWPVFLGLLFLSLPEQQQEELGVIKKSFVELLEKNPSHVFTEYWSTDKIIPNGTNPLCFSAAGILFMHASKNDALKNILPT
jgi:Alkaline and neutral invertase